MIKREKNGVVLLDKKFLLRAFIISAILLLLSLIFRNPLLAAGVFAVWPMIGVVHLLNYIMYR